MGLLRRVLKIIPLDQLKIILSIALLTYASWRDLRSRYVPDKVWLIFAPLGAGITLFQGFSLGIEYLKNVALSFLIISALSIIIFYLDLFGGADVKALMCLSLTLPYPPLMPLYKAGLVLPLFTLTIFNNAILLSASISLIILFYNVYCRMRGERLFEGLESESKFKKLIALLIGYRVSPSKIVNSDFIYPIEEVTLSSDGSISRKLRISPRIGDENYEFLDFLNKEEYSGIRVWASPTLPFIVFIALGLIAALLFGDLILLILKGAL